MFSRATTIVRPRSIQLLGCVVLLLAFSVIAHATSLPCPNLTNPPCQRGFPLYFGEVPEASNSDVGGSSPTVVDLDGSGRMHIIVGSLYGVFAYRSDGTFAWAFHTDVPVGSKPAVGDVDGTGEQQVVVTTGSTTTVAQGGTLYVLHSNGSLKCSYHYESGAKSSAALAPLDPLHPDKLNIVFGIWGGASFHILALNPDCSVYWDKNNTNALVVDSVWSSPAIVDLDGDGQLDVVIGQDSNQQTIGGFTTPNGGMLRAFRGNGAGELPGFPKLFDEVLWSSPAIGPVATRDGLSIVFGNGRCWDVTRCAPNGNTHSVTEAIYGFSANGASLGDWPHLVPGRDTRTISPALADLDGDGTAEVIIAEKIKTTDNLNDLYGEMHVLGAHGSELPGWPVQPNIAANCSGTNVHWVSEGSPIVADLKGNGQYEILLPTNSEVVVWDSNGNQLSRDTTTACSPKPDVYQLLGVGHFTGSSAVAVDLDGSGQITVVAAGNYKDTAGKFWGALNAWKFPGSASLRTLPWAEHRHDQRNTGFYQPDTIFGNGFE